MKLQKLTKKIRHIKGWRLKTTKIIHFGVSNFFLSKMKTIYMSKDFIMLQKVSISNKYWCFFIFLFIKSL